MTKILKFLKNETVLTVAWILAILSSIWVHPSKEYIGYIDFRSLGILWSLMVIMAALRVNGLFDQIGRKLLSKTKKIWQLEAVLVFLCFFFSMLITNDVALITFVPFSMYMLRLCDREDLLVPVIVFQTIAANLGSMFTPIGNPQNLYLYGLSNMGLMEFISILFPYTVLTFVLLCVSLYFLKGKSDAVKSASLEVSLNGPMYKIILYCLLFVASLLVVAHLIPYQLLIVLVLIVVGIFDLRCIKRADYILLLTFIGFFIFTGNLSRITFIQEALTNLVKNKEVIIGILSSQCISNVPAALLLSSFTSNYKDLIIGVNLGGLGTLIASMASLISYKLFTQKYNEQKGRYFKYFTIMNIIYLLILVLFYLLIKRMGIS